MAKKRVISAAVVGLGRAGWGMHVGGMRNDDRFEIVGVMDTEKERLKQASDELGCEVYDDYKKLIDETEAELIVIATPSFLHREQGEMAMKSGRHVVIDKPMASNVREVDRLIGVSERTGRHLMVHQTHRWGKLFAFMVELKRSKKIGELFGVSCQRHGFNRRNDWQCLQRNGGGQMNNLGSHMMDLAIRLVGSPMKDLLCDMKHIVDAGDCEDHIKCVMRMENGVVIDLELTTSVATPHISGKGMWTLMGTCGTATIIDGKAHIEWFDPKKVKGLKMQKKLSAMDRRYDNDDKLPWVVEDVEAVGPDVGSFYDNVWGTIRERKVFRVKPSEIREMMAIMAKCRKQNPGFEGI